MSDICSPPKEIPKTETAQFAYKVIIKSDWKSIDLNIIPGKEESRGYNVGMTVAMMEQSSSGALQRTCSHGEKKKNFTTMQVI